MAEEKKENKKDEKKGDFKEKDKKDDAAPASSHEISGWAIVGGAILLSLLLSRVGDTSVFFQKYFTVAYFLSVVPEPIKAVFRDVAFGYIIFANVLSLILLVGLVYVLVKMIDVERQWEAQIYPEQVITTEHIVKNSRWELAMKHIGSDNPSDWRLSILESDIVLDEMLDKLGYVGDTIGDKLKKAVPGDFKTLDNAWEAHKIRNAIAHEGQDFVLTQREAQRIIRLYQSVFEEFDYI